MSVPFQHQFNRVRRLPRAAQVGVVAGVVLVGWLLCRDTVWAWAGRLSNEAGEMRELLERGRDQTDRRLPSAKDSVVAHGPVRPPRRADVSAALLTQTAAAILQANGVANHSYDERTGRLPAAALKDVLTGQQRVERVIADFKFDASPDVVTKVLADLEASPDIVAISSLRLQRLDPASRKLHVILTVETWVIATDAPTRGLS